MFKILRFWLWLGLSQQDNKTKSYKATRQKVAKIKDANHGCKDEGNDDGKVDDNGGFLFLSYDRLW